MAITIDDRVKAMIARVPGMDRQSLVSLRQNALKFGEAAAPLLEAIDLRLGDFDMAGGMAPHRLEFARAMLRIVERAPTMQWVAARDLFEKAQREQADSPFVIWMQGNGARQIPVTKALADVLPEFPHIEHRKDGPDQSARVFYRAVRGF